MNKKILCVSKMPSAGLGNKLFCWAAGVVFSEKNNCAHYITGLTKLHIGPYLRRERSKRFYLGYFQNERWFIPFQSFIWPTFHLPQREADRVVNQSGIYIFSEIPHWRNHFITLKDHRSLIQQAFWNSLSKKVLSRIQKHSEPIISVHIRMGDFRVLKEEEDFSKVGSVRTPLGYFVSLIEKIREKIGPTVEATIFSDGTDEELSEILCIPNVKRAKNDLDIVHIALMSKSKILLMSAGSTFSFWAGFLSDGILVNHFQHLHATFRPESFNKQVYEGGLSPDQNIEDIPLLHKNLLSLKSDLN